MRRRININQNQLVLPFGEIGSRTRAISYDNRVRFFWTLVGISIFSLLIYIYAINSTARSIALRQNLEKQATEVSTELDSLEFAYIDLKNNITMELAYAYGFRESKSPLYVSRTPTKLTFNTVK